MSVQTSRQLVETVLGTRFFGSGRAIPYVSTPSETETPLVLVVGDNASGKSFFRRVLVAVAQDAGVEAIDISMEGRRKVSYNPGLVFVYGDEESESTGVNSIRTVLTGIRTCRSRERPHVVVWDEPDVGLSDGNAASVGAAIAEFSRTAPETTRVVVVATHRKVLVEKLAAAPLHYLYLGDEDGPRAVRAWLTAPPVVQPLEAVLERSRARFRDLATALKRRRR